MRHARADYMKIQAPKSLIPADEPVFLIRAQDSLSGEALRHYADLNDAHGGDATLSASVREHALLMDAWPKKKMPDLPTEQPNTGNPNPNTDRD